MTNPAALRALFRRHLEALRARRPPPPPSPHQRRHQSSGPERGKENNNKNKNKKEGESVPVPNAMAPLPIWQRLGPLTRAGRAYARAQRRRPWATQLATSLCMWVCADASAQRIGGKGEHDYVRTARSLAIGGAASIPSFEWFMFLARSFNYSSQVLSIAVKVIVNQLCFTPVINCYFFGMQALLSGDGARETWEHVRLTVPVSMLNSLKLWPAVTALNFAFVPVEYRGITMGCVGIGWQTYLCYLNRQAKLREEANKEKAHAVVAVVPAPASAEVVGDKKMSAAA